MAGDEPRQAQRHRSPLRAAPITSQDFRTRKPRPKRTCPSCSTVLTSWNKGPKCYACQDVKGRQAA